MRVQPRYVAEFRLSTIYIGEHRAMQHFAGGIVYFPADLHCYVKLRGCLKVSVP